MSAIATVILTESISLLTDKAFLRHTINQTAHAIKMCEKKTNQSRHALEKARRDSVMYRARAEERQEGAKKQQDILKSAKWAIRAQNEEAALRRVHVETGRHIDLYRQMKERLTVLQQAPAREEEKEKEKEEKKEE